MEYASAGTKISAGRQALTVYHNLMIEWYAEKYKFSLEQLENEVSRKNENFLAQLGSAVITAKLGQRRLKEAMERVVENTNTSPLTIPGIMQFEKGITDEISSFDFSLLGDASLDLAQVVVKKVQKVGETIDDVASGGLNTISTAAKLLPVVLISVVGLVLFTGFKIAKNTKKVSDVTPKVV